MYFKYVSTCIYQYFLSGVRLEVRLSFGFFTAQVVFVSWGGVTLAGTCMLMSLVHTRHGHS